MYRKMFVMAFVASVLMISCKDDDNNDDSPGISENGNFLIETTVKNPDGMTGSSYIQLVSEFSGKVDNSKAVQLEYSNTVNVYGDDIFVFPSFGANAVNEIRKYNRKNNDIVKVGSLPVPAGSGAFNIVKINEEKAYVSLFMLGTVWVVNTKTMKKIGEINLSSYAHKDNSPDPSFGFVRDGFYYLPLNQINAQFMPHADYLQSDVAIIDIKTDKVVKVISEKETGMSFPTRPMFNENLIYTTENNDLYIACTGFYGLNPNNTKTGFICIPSGKQEFDSSKSWDVSKTTIEGTSYKPSCVFNCLYVGSGKVVAYVNIQELNENNPYIAKNTMAVLMDFNSKTIKKIDGIPLTNGHSVFVDSYKDKVILGSYGDGKSGFFTYNPLNEEVSLTLSTIGNPVFFHSFE